MLPFTFFRQPRAAGQFGADREPGGHYNRQEQGRLHEKKINPRQMLEESTFMKGTWLLATC
jgi:hypothetical protein